MSARIISLLNNPQTLNFMKNNPDTFQIICSMPDLLFRQGYTNKQIKGVLWQATNGDIRNFIESCDLHLEDHDANVQD